MVTYEALRTVAGTARLEFGMLVSLCAFGLEDLDGLEMD